MSQADSRVSESPGPSSDQSEQGRGGPAEATGRAAVEQLLRFEGDPARFFAELIQLQRRLIDAREAVMLSLSGQGNEAQLIAMDPAPAGGAGEMPAWATRALSGEDAVVARSEGAQVTAVPRDDLYDATPTAHALVLPLSESGGGVLVAAFLTTGFSPQVLPQWVERLTVSRAVQDAFELRLTLAHRNQELSRLAGSVQAIGAFNEQDRLRGAGMAVCNELAERYNAERVSLGLLRGRYVKLIGLSHTEKVVRKMRVVQDIERTMEECLDQDEAVLYPTSQRDTDRFGAVTRAAEHLSIQHGPTRVLSIPLRRNGDAVGVLTVELSPDQRFSSEQIEALQLTAELVTPRLANLAQHDRFFLLRWADRARAVAGNAVGAEHAWAKLTVIAVVLGLLASLLFQGDVTVDAPFRLKPDSVRVVSAPYSGFLNRVAVEPDAAVVAGQTLLAELDTSELRLELADRRAELARYIGEADLAMREDKAAEAKIARAQTQRTQAQIDRLVYRIEQAKIIAPLTGTVLQGDLKRRVGAPVEQGEVLFEIGSADELYAELAVPESAITRIAVGQSGRLASAAQPGEYLPIELEKINPVAEVIGEQNSFRVRAEVQADGPIRLTPGTEGVARVTVGRAPYLWVWTKGLVDWVRLKLWL